MRIPMALPAFLLAGATLGGCSTGVPMGVLPRDPVPPPPSVAGSEPRRAAGERAGTVAQRRGLDVPRRLTPPRP